MQREVIFFFRLPCHLAENTHNRSGSEWEVDCCCLILVPAATPEAQSCTGANKDKLLCTSERSGREYEAVEITDGPEMRRACKRKAYLISTERHKARFLMQLSALIRSSAGTSVKTHIHYATVMQENSWSLAFTRWCAPGIQDSEQWEALVWDRKTSGSLNRSKDGVWNPSGDCDCNWGAHLLQQSPQTWILKCFSTVVISKD